MICEQGKLPNYGVGDFGFYIYIVCNKGINDGFIVKLYTKKRLNVVKPYIKGDVLDIVCGQANVLLQFGEKISK